jgi:hypothetical protein
MLGGGRAGTPLFQAKDLSLYDYAAATNNPDLKLT